MLRVGPYRLKSQEEPDIINVGKETVTELPGTRLSRVPNPLR